MTSILLGEVAELPDTCWELRLMNSGTLQKGNGWTSLHLRGRVGRVVPNQIHPWARCGRNWVPRMFSHWEQIKVLNSLRKLSKGDPLWYVLIDTHEKKKRFIFEQHRSCRKQPWFDFLRLMFTQSVWKRVSLNSRFNPWFFPSKTCCGKPEFEIPPNIIYIIIWVCLKMGYTFNEIAIYIVGIVWSAKPLGTFWGTLWDPHQHHPTIPKALLRKSRSSTPDRKMGKRSSKSRESGNLLVLN